MANQMPLLSYGPVFQLVKVDEYCDLGNHSESDVGKFVYNGKRCCENCGLIFGSWIPNGDFKNGPSFVALEELMPINQEARELLATIHA